MKIARKKDITQKVLDYNNRGKYIPLVRVFILVINKLVNLHCRIKYGKMKTKLKL